MPCTILARSVECVDISSRSQRRPAATNANPAPGGPGNRSSGGKGASNVVAVVRTCQVCGHRNSQPFAAPHVARRIAESEARAIKQLRLRQQQQQAEGPQQIQEAPVPQRQEAQQTMEDLEREPRQQQPVDATTVEAAPPAIVETATLQPCCKPTADAIYVASVPPEDVESWGVGTDLVARASETRADAAIHADETVPVVEDTWAACLHAVAANGTNDDEFSATAERHETLALPSLPQPLMDGVRAIAAETDGSPADAEVASAQEAQNPEEGVTARMVVDNAQEAVAEDPAAVDCVKETGTTEDAAGVAALRDCAEVLVAVSSLAAETPCFEGQRVAEPQDVADGCSNQMADVAEESSPAAATGRASEAAPAKEQAEEQGSAGNAVHAAQAVQDEITAEDAEMHARKASEVGGSTTGAEGRSAAVPDDAVAPTASTVTRKPLEVRYPAVAAGGAAVDAVADDQELGLQAAPKLPSAMEQPYIVCAAVGSAVGEAPGGAVKMGTVASSIGEMAAGLLKAAMGQESFGVACVSTVPRATQLAEQEPAELTLVTTGGVEEGHPTPQVNVGRGDGGDERPPTANPGAEAAIWTSDEQAMEVDEGEEIADGREGEAGKSEEDNDWEGCVQEVSAEESWKTSKPVDSLEVILQRVPQKCVAAQSCTILHEEMLGRPGAASRGAVLISSKEEDGEERASNAKDQDEDFGEEEDAEAVGKAMGFVAAAAGAVTGPIIGTEMAALGMATGAAAMAAAGAAMCCIHDSESNKDEGPAPEAVAAVLLEVHVVEAAVAQKKPPSSLQERHVEEGGSEIPAVGNNTAALAASPQVTGEAANVALEAEGSAVTASMQMAVGVTEGEDAAESQKVEEDDAHGWGTPGITSGDVSHGINEGGNSEEERDPEEEKEEACGEMAMAAASVLQKADTVSPAQQSGLRWAAALHKPIATAEAAVATAAKAAAGDAATVACEAATARSLVKPQCMPSCEPEHLPVVLDRARPVQPAQPAVQSQDLLSKKHGERTQVQTQQQRQQRTRVLAVGAGNELADPEVMVGCAAVGRAANEMSVLSEGGMPSRLSEAPLKALRTRCQQSRRQKDQQIVQQPGALHTRSEPSHKRRRAQPDWLPGGYVSETSIHPLLPQEREDGVLVYEAPYAQVRIMLQEYHTHGK
ncbi:hypothetical protein Vretifemale_15348 [Volvox reticuliferus]|uniref:Uncharacterized protein n=1 Tax=Volvox reticuliferus TaxID=1737510 RepID=A0A8J4CRX2_9CHLO|nr:hypothetical protein Vretifemale_15348 [Volvox reticuliferus]